MSRRIQNEKYQDTPRVEICSALAKIQELPRLRQADKHRHFDMLTTKIRGYLRANGSFSESIKIQVASSIGDKILKAMSPYDDCSWSIVGPWFIFNVLDICWVLEICNYANFWITVGQKTLGCNFFIVQLYDIAKSSWRLSFAENAEKVNIAGAAQMFLWLSMCNQWQVF